MALSREARRERNGADGAFPAPEGRKTVAHGARNGDPASPRRSSPSAVLPQPPKGGGRSRRRRSAHGRATQPGGSSAPCGGGRRREGRERGGRSEGGAGRFPRLAARATACRPYGAGYRPPTRREHDAALGGSANAAVPADMDSTSDRRRSSKRYGSAPTAHAPPRTAALTAPSGG